MAAPNCPPPGPPRPKPPGPPGPPCPGPPGPPGPPRPPPPPGPPRPNPNPPPLGSMACHCSGVNLRWMLQTAVVSKSSAGFLGAGLFAGGLSDGGVSAMSKQPRHKTPARPNHICLFSNEEFDPGWEIKVGLRDRKSTRL